MSLRDYVNATMQPIFADLRQIPVNDETRPSDEEVARVQEAIDLRKARIARERREREARERARSQRRGGDFTPPDAA